MKLIDGDKLKEEVKGLFCPDGYKLEFIRAIDNAPAVEDRPTGDLISREALKKYAIPCEIHNGALTDLCVPLYQIDYAPAVEERPQWSVSYLHEDSITNAPAVEERPTGHWEKTGPNVYHCSHCGCVDSIGFANFCWLCGADMRGDAKQPSNGKEKKTLTEAFMEDVNRDEVDYNELCYRTGHHMTMCDCELCDHRHECSGYEGDDNDE